jgi:DNA-directed RNA polymerase subunit beta'
MYTGFAHSTASGASIGVDDFVIPEDKKRIIAEAEAEVAEIESQYASGLVTAGEKYNKVVDIWSRANDLVARSMMDGISKERVTTRDGEEVEQASFNSVYIYADSGARGSPAQIRQLAGMRGLMTRPDGSIIENAITANFREGLSVNEYFISTHGARKGLADTALKTANSGYLTRRLVDVAQDVVITEHDCGTSAGLLVSAIIEGGDVVEPLGDRVLGRVVANDVYAADGKTVIIENGTMLDEAWVDQLDQLGVDEIRVRSPITCNTRHGVCSSLLRARPGTWPPGERRRGGWRHRRAVHRRAGYPAHHAHVPHRWRGIAGDRHRQHPGEARRSRSAAQPEDRDPGVRRAGGGVPLRRDRHCRRPRP